MSVLRNATNAYREVSVRTATQGKLIVMLYDEAVKQLDLAISLMQAKTRSLDKVHNALIKSQDIITELMAGLDFDLFERHRDPDGLLTFPYVTQVYRSTL